MARKSKKTHLAELHQEALAQFQDSYDLTFETRERSIADRRFINIPGAMWDWDEEDQYENRIKLEVDQISPIILRAKNEYKQNRLAAEFRPKDGSKNDELADTCAGRYRADTMDPTGIAARDGAFEQAIEGGFGAVRLRTEYESKEKDHRRICLEPIDDAVLRVFFDANSKLPDKSDADHGFVLTPYTRRAFERKWKGKATSWPIEIATPPKFKWFGTKSDPIMVAEYFVKEDAPETWRVFELPEEFEAEPVELMDPDDDEVADLLAQGYVEGEPIKREGQRVHKYILSGAEILEDCGIIAGKEIPIAVQWGHRTVIDHVEYFRGDVSKARDSQITHNIQVSAVAEAAALSGPEEVILPDVMVNPYLEEWGDANTARRGFRRLATMTNPDGSLQMPGPLGYTKSPAVPEAVGTLIQLTEAAIDKVMGNIQNAEQVEPDLSGVALELIQARIDMRTFGHLDEAAKMERRIAQIWLSMAGDVYVEKGRKLKTVSPDGQVGQAELMRPMMDESGVITREMDFSKADYDIVTEVGPSSSTKRMALFRSASAMAMRAADPSQAALWGLVAVMNYEGEGLSDVREWARKQLVTMGAMKPTKQDLLEQQQAAAAQGEAPPDPQAQLAAAMSAEAEAKAVKAQAETEKAVAQTEGLRADTAATLAQIPIEQQKAAIEAAQAIAQGLNGAQQQGVDNAGQ